MLELRLTPQPQIVAGQVERVVVEQVIPVDVADDARELHVSPVVVPSGSARKVGRRKATHDVLQLDTVGEVARDRRSHRAARARPQKLDSPSSTAPPNTCTLRKNTMPFGPQYSMEFGKTSRIHERASRLSGADLLQLAPCVAQPEGRLPRVDADAEHVELEDRPELARGPSA